MQTVPIIREPTPRTASSPTRSRSKSPTRKRYSHLLYLSEAERQLYVSKMEKSSASSLRSSNSVRSNRTTSSSAGSQTSTSTSVLSKLSMHMPRYVDDHYPLIATIHLQNISASVPKDHPAFWCARQMAQIHNTIIRALNASWNQAVLVQSDTQEAADFLLFNQMLFNTLNHHHHVEDDYMFPAIEKLLGQPGAMDENTRGHDSFAEGLTIFQKYVFITKSAEYNGATLRHIIESFAPNLIQHLHDEIPTLANLHTLDGKELMKIWKHAEHMATKDNSLYTDAPWTLGCQDKSFTIDGEKCGFPNVPWVIEAVIRNWHAKKHAGAWKFCPSDLSGKRRLMPVA